jgi:glutathione S-transferase
MMKKRTARIELYYWPGIQGRGEFVRLLLEDAGCPYSDIVRSRGMGPMMNYLDGKKPGALPFAPPFVKVGDTVVAQTANILAFLSAHLGLGPKTAAQRSEMNQIQLTIADFVGEIHDTHHPIAGSLYYDDQKAAAKRRSRDFVAQRLPKYLGWFERILVRNRSSEGTWLVGSDLTYVDLSLFQVIAGLRYAFPNALRHCEANVPHVIALHDRVAARPRVARYLKSKRRLPFNQMGIFRHYPELDGSKRGRRK